MKIFTEDTLYTQNKEEKIKLALTNLSDGEFIDLLDNVIGIVYGLTATEFLIHEYDKDAQVKKLLEESITI